MLLQFVYDFSTTLCFQSIDLKKICCVVDGNQIIMLMAFEQIYTDFFPCSHRNMMLSHRLARWGGSRKLITYRTSADKFSQRGGHLGPPYGFTHSSHGGVNANVR